ncbi:hypothetical protein [Pontibacter ummariensis]|uniref:hypothetical protein n=1 Tax=Pontibacter ummariensis TaxID=1610492 RepID=UPI000B76C6E4|nr:hypothetical protein [Pontibacter ummariensis]
MLVVVEHLPHGKITPQQCVFQCNFKIEHDFGKEVFELFEEVEEYIKAIKNCCDLCAESDSSETFQTDLKELFNKVGFD